MRPLDDCRLYGIIDLGYVERGDVARIVEQMIEGGVDLIQYAEKTSQSANSWISQQSYMNWQRNLPPPDRERSR